MMRRMAITLLALWPLAGAADTVEVRSGEHAGFSRLVVTLGRELDWSLGRTQEGYALQLAGDVDLETGAIFDMIPRTRIAAARSPEPGRLDIILACDCHADAFELRGGRLVVDIKDGPPPPGAAFEAPAGPLEAADAAPSAETSAPRALPTDAPVEPPVAETVPMTSLPPPDRARAAPGLSLPVADAGTAPPPGPDVGLPAPDRRQTELTLPPTRSDRVRAAEAAVIAQLARAAAQGLIEPDLRPPLRPEVSAEHTGEKPSPAPPAADPVRDALEDRANVRVRTSVDRDLGGAGTDAQTVASGNCLPDVAFALVAPDPSMPGRFDVGPLIAATVDELGRPVPDAVERLARTYLFFGFGAETRALLAAYPVELPHRGVLLALADIVDGLPVANPGPLAGQRGCPGDAALWSALAGAGLPADEVARGSVLQSFSRLPLHLRRHLGPDLAGRFLAAGDEATALAVRNAVRRAPGHPGEEAELLEAEIALGAGRDDEALDRLDRLVRDDGAVATQALIRLIDETLARGEAVEEILIGDAEALAFERRGTEEGVRLLAAALRARLAAGQADRVLADLDIAARSGALPATLAADLEAQALTRLVEDLSDAAFLARAFSPDWTARLAGAPAGLRRAVAGRVLALGFPDRAGTLLGPTGDLSVEDRVLRGRIALARGEADTALSHIAGLSDDTAERLRAEAFARTARHDAAVRAFRAAGAEDDAVAAAWRAGDWAAVAAAGADLRRRAAALALRDVAGPPAPLAGPGRDALSPTPLAEGRSLLDQSAETRRIFDALLGAGAEG